MAYRLMPPGMTSVPVSMRRTPEEQLAIAKEAYDRACKTLELAETELDGLIKRAETENSDRLDLMISASRAWVSACESSKKKAANKLKSKELSNG